MRKINFAFISDVLFAAVCAFFITFVQTRYAFKSGVVALILSLLTAAATAVIAFLILYKRAGKRAAQRLKESERKLLSLHLSVSSKESVTKLFIAALDGTYVAGNHIEDEKTAYYFKFKMSPLSADDVAEIIRKNIDKKKCILCCSASPEALSLAQDFAVETRDVGEIYVALKDKALLPEKYALGDIKKAGAIKRIKRRLNRKLTLPLFLSGMTFLLFSSFTFYPVYHLTAGAILTAAAAACALINPK